MLELACFRAHPKHVDVLVGRGASLTPALRRRFPGLRKMRFARVGDGRWLQLGFWDNREGAEAAASGLAEVPEMRDWLAQVDEFAEAA